MPCSCETKPEGCQCGTKCSCDTCAPPAPKNQPEETCSSCGEECKCGTSCSCDKK